MKTPESGSVSLWMGQLLPLKREPLRKNLTSDVCVVGAGIAGLTTAYYLLKEGRSVVVLESAGIGNGQSGRTTGHFVTALDDRYFMLEKYHGLEGTRLAAESHSAAIDMAEDIIEIEGIDCNWRRLSGYLFLAPEDEFSLLQKEYEALRRTGLTGIEWLERAPLSAFNTGKCLHFPRQACLHIMKYLSGLTGVIERLGGKIYTDTHVAKIEGGPAAQVVTQDRFIVRASSIVVATNTPVNDFAVIHTKQTSYRTYVIAAQVPKGSVDFGLYWDSHNPYHYIRIEPGEGVDPKKDFLIIGGEDHRVGQERYPGQAFARLESWSKKHFPMIQSISYRWSGQVLEPVDGLGYIGRNPIDAENVYIVTGDSGNGMTHCTLGASLIRDLILGRENPWEALYSPSRIRLRAIPEYVKENVNSVIQYSNWAMPHPALGGHQIDPGEGRIVREGLTLVAVSRSEDGRLHRCSAICPHMGCAVVWNKVEKSWDCPCHGSRFDGKGRVINGPAIANLLELNVVGGGNRAAQKLERPRKR